MLSFIRLGFLLTNECELVIITARDCPDNDDDGHHEGNNDYGFRSFFFTNFPGKWERERERERERQLI